MKLIIDISEGSYNTIKECYERGELLTTICMQIATGTPYEERPQGEWVDQDFDDLKISDYRCNQCGHYQDDITNFCPNCGADMRKGGAE